MKFSTNDVRPNLPKTHFVIEMCIYVSVCMCPSDFAYLNKLWLGYAEIFFEMTREDFSDTTKSE